MQNARPLRDAQRGLHRACHPVDNQAAIIQIGGESSLLKAKYVGVGLKFLCGFPRRGVVSACYLMLELMIADLMTTVLDTTNIAKLHEYELMRII